MDHAVGKILKLGAHTILAKVDIKDAFRMLPVHLADGNLLAMQWDNIIYIDSCLPFGLHSAPKCFNIMANRLTWIALQWDISDPSPPK